jgi:hypothetical protein
VAGLDPEGPGAVGPKKTFTGCKVRTGLQKQGDRKMSMIADLTAARERIKTLEAEIAGLKAQTAKPATPPAAPTSPTPTWDAYGKITDPAKRTAFYNEHEAALKAEMKATITNR